MALTENTPAVTAKRPIPRSAERVSAAPPSRGDPQWGDVLAVVVLPGDVALMKIDDDVPEWIAPTAPVLQPSGADIGHLADFLNKASRVTLFCGASEFLDTVCDLKNPDFALMVEAMGVRGIRVEKPRELKGAIEAALAYKGPVLVDVVSAPRELAMPPRTTLDQAYHFGMYMMKAVLDGRATQLVDLAKVNLSR
jgi:thiamine pyrophosphate-dependent acetolactate synthase large subunit-like protein